MPPAVDPFLASLPPMGIYETLYAFKDAFGAYMGSEGTHPWSQGYPLTSQIPNGPTLPSSVDVNADTRLYPKAWGHPELRDAICNYYNSNYGSHIVPENVMVFAGGRPALIAALLLLRENVTVNVASTEYTPYYDILRKLKKQYHLVESNPGNNFYPTNAAYFERDAASAKNDVMVLLSNPCNPTGSTRYGDELKDFVAHASSAGNGALIDEAYEMFHSPAVSAMQYIPDINETNAFVVGACTKGLQSPGIRIGWCISSIENTTRLSNFSSFAMGGVSHLSQAYAVKLFEPSRVAMARAAISAFYDMQRERYETAFKSLGLTIWSGKGGFYHWCQLPAGITAEALNAKLFLKGAAILKGVDCDMKRLKDKSELATFFRFSFGPLDPSTFDSDVQILAEVLANIKAAQK